MDIGYTIGLWALPSRGVIGGCYSEQQTGAMGLCSLGLIPHTGMQPPQSDHRVPSAHHCVITCPDVRETPAKPSWTAARSAHSQACLPSSELCTHGAPLSTGLPSPWGSPHHGALCPLSELIHSRDPTCLPRPGWVGLSPLHWPRGSPLLAGSGPALTVLPHVHH